MPKCQECNDSFDTEHGLKVHKGHKHKNSNLTGDITTGSISNTEKAEFTNANLDPNSVRMANVKPTQEQGVTGIQQYSGVLDEDFLDAIQGREKLTTYQEMRMDPTIRAALFTYDKLLQQVDWHVNPASGSEEDLEAAEFVEQNMEDMEHSWKEMISQINTRHDFGFAPMEQVYKRRDSKQSQFNDGRLGWKKIEIRRQDTLHKWLYDEDNKNELVGMRQQNPTTFEYIDIPLDKLLIFTVQGQGGSPEGEALIRPAYEPWFYKSKFQDLLAIGIERDCVGIPMARVPWEYFSDDADSEQKSILKKFRDMVQNIGQGEQMGLTLPDQRDEEGNQRFDFEMVEAAGEPKHDIRDNIKDLKQEMLRTTLTDFLMLGEDSQVGSFALSDSRTSLIGLAGESLLSDIASKFNRKAIPQLMDLNDFDVDQYPTLDFDQIRQEDIENVGSVLKDMAAAGAQPFANDEENEMLDTILRRLDLPTTKEQMGPGQVNMGESSVGTVEDQPDNNNQKKAESIDEFLQKQSDFDTGDIVATPRGEKGVVVAEKGSSFEFPTGPGSGNENVKKIKVEDDENMVIVGFVGESVVYEESDLEKTKLEDGNADSGSGEALATVGHIDFEEADWPEGWNQNSLLDFWESVGGSFSEAVSRLEDSDVFGTEDARGLAADMKSQILGTDRWRNRF